MSEFSYDMGYETEYDGVVTASAARQSRLLPTSQVRGRNDCHSESMRGIYPIEENRHREQSEARRGDPSHCEERSDAAIYPSDSYITYSMMPVGGAGDQGPKVPEYTPPPKPSGEDVQGPEAKSPESPSTENNRPENKSPDAKGTEDAPKGDDAKLQEQQAKADAAESAVENPEDTVQDQAYTDALSQDEAPEGSELELSKQLFEQANANKAANKEAEQKTRRANESGDTGESRDSTRQNHEEKKQARKEERARGSITPETPRDKQARAQKGLGALEKGKDPETPELPVKTDVGKETGIDAKKESTPEKVLTPKEQAAKEAQAKEKVRVAIKEIKTQIEKNKETLHSIKKQSAQLRQQLKDAQQKGDEKKVAKLREELSHLETQRRKVKEENKDLEAKLAKMEEGLEEGKGKKTGRHREKGEARRGDLVSKNDTGEVDDDDQSLIEKGEGDLILAEGDYESPLPPAKEGGGYVHFGAEGKDEKLENQYREGSKQLAKVNKSFPTVLPDAVHLFDDDGEGHSGGRGGNRGELAERGGLQVASGMRGTAEISKNGKVLGDGLQLFKDMEKLLSPEELELFKKYSDAERKRLIARVTAPTDGLDEKGGSELNKC